MKKVFIFPIFIFSLFLVSCDINNDIDNQSAVKIPIDSLFFSCKINNQTIELKSPAANNVYWSQQAFQLNKIKNSTKDSILVSYSKTYLNDYYRVKISFSESVLLDIDTTCFWCSTIPSQRSLLLRKGIHNMQYIERFNFIEPMHQYHGFNIEIHDLIKNITYTSNIGHNDPNISTEYMDFLSKSYFEITNVSELNTGIYEDYQNAWFINSLFRCKLYIDSKSTETTMLTDGVLNCIY